MQFVAKVELFERRWQGWLLSRARRLPDPPRPVGRDRDGDGAASSSSAAAPSASSPRGPASGRARSARRKRGVGRLALETGAAVVPVAVHGSEHVRRGWRIRPRKVKLRAGRPMTFPRTEHPSPALAATVTERIWPNIELQWEWLGGLPPLRKAAVIGAGSWGTRDGGAARPGRARGPARDPLRGEGRRDQRQARERTTTCPGVPLPENISSSAPPTSSSAAST